MEMKHGYACVIGLVIGISTLTGCATPNENARVHIVYEQLANFFEFRLDPNSFSTTGAAGGIFILYKIKQISNLGSQATTYVFYKHKVVAVAPDKTSNLEPGADSVLLLGKLVTNLEVQPGQIKNNPGCIIKHVLTSNPQSLTLALVDLIHQFVQPQPVSMKRLSGDNSTAIVSNPLPSFLLNLCGN